MSSYTPTGKPEDNTRGISKQVRDEFVLVQTAVNSKSDLGGTTATSTTSMEVTSPATKSFTIEAGKELVPGRTVFIADNAAPGTNNMTGTVITYNDVTGATTVDVTSHNGSGTKTAWTIGLSTQSGVTLNNNTFTGYQNFARATVVSHATTADIWNAAGNQINFTGVATVTAFPDAPQAGATRELICAAACAFTAGANMLIDGIDSGSSVTCAANDVVIVRAVSTTQFRLTRQRYDGKPQREIGSHKIIVHTGNGHGSTATQIRRFTTIEVNTGTAMTYADSATAGASITINEDGIYSFSFSDLRSGVDSVIGISVNAPDLTYSISSGNAAPYRLCGFMNAAASDVGVCSATAKLSSGDIVRPHTNGGNDSVNAGVCFFRAEKIGNV